MKVLQGTAKDSKGAQRGMLPVPDLTENLHSLVASQYAEADRVICGHRNFISSTRPRC